MRALRHRKGNILRRAKKNGGYITHSEAIDCSCVENISCAREEINYVARKIEANIQSEIVDLENRLPKLSEMDDYYESMNVDGGEIPVTENMIVDEAHMVKESMNISCGSRAPGRNSYGPN